MAVKKDRDSQEKARRRYVDQKGQWIDTTPASVKKRQQKAWKALEASLTPAQRKALGLKPKKAK